MGMFTIRFVLIVLQSVLFVTTINGQKSEFDSNKVTEMLQHAVDCHKTPGMAVAVVKDGQILYNKGFGHTDLDKKTPVTENTLFGIASISKSFAAALLVKLLDEKTNLTLDSKVRELLGDAFVMPDKVRTMETTFTDMLAHKTALLSNNKIRYDSDFNRDTLLSRLRLLPSDKQFRVDYIYNNLVYGLVGRLAEIIDGSGKRWEELVDEHFFTPLGMDKSTFLTTVDYTRNDCAKGFSEIEGPDKPQKITPAFSKRYAEVCASGAVMSTAAEMTKWMNFHIQLGKNWKNETVMDESLVRDLHKQRFVVSHLKYLDIERPKFPITSSTRGYALGLRVGHYRGYELLSHTGTTFGYSAVMSILPKDNIGVIVLMNNSDRKFRQRAAITQYLLDSALGFDPYLNSTTICSYPVPWIKEKYLTSTYRPKRPDTPIKASPDEYKGKYTHEAYGKMEIEYNSTLDSPVMTYGWGRWELIQYPKKNYRLYAKGIEPVYPGDQSSMYFVTHPDNSSVVIGFKATAFERNRPPIFCKEDQLAACRDVVKTTYPEALKMEGICPGSAASISYIGQMSLLLPVVVVLLSIFIRQ